jgi:hypothetical protein
MTSTPPLLVGMAGGKPRAQSAIISTPLEIILHVHVADLLRAHCLPDWRWTHINRKAKDAREGKIFKTMGVQRGWFDFELISPQARPHFLDVKRIGEGLSDEQEDFRGWCVRCGIPCAVAWTVDDVLRTFGEWGCLRVTYETRETRA